LEFVKRLFKTYLMPPLLISHQSLLDVISDMMPDMKIVQIYFCKNEYPVELNEVKVVG